MLQGAQLRRRLDAEALHEPPAGIAVDLERLGVAARAVEREHVLAAEALAQRMLGTERLELADERGVAAELERRVDPLLERGQPQLLEPLDRRAGKRLVREVGERRPAPEA